MMTWGQLGLQNGYSSFMVELSEFHDYSMMLLVMILVWVAGAMVSISMSKYWNHFLLEHQKAEWSWTVLPMVFLLFIALPSLRLVYISDESFDHELSVKVIGHQWYWSYEYNDFSDIMFDSYMVGADDLGEGQFRLLEVDNRVVVPMEVNIRFLVTSGDVLHSWAVPSLGMKVDAVPGRINQLNSYILTSGVYYGQCSEICGANHSFMPIVLEALNMDGFMTWVEFFKG